MADVLIDKFGCSVGSSLSLRLEKNELSYRDWNQFWCLVGIHFFKWIKFKESEIQARSHHLADIHKPPTCSRSRAYSWKGRLRVRLLAQEGREYQQGILEPLVIELSTHLGYEYSFNVVPIRSMKAETPDWSPLFYPFICPIYHLHSVHWGFKNADLILRSPCL